MKRVILFCLLSIAGGTLFGGEAADKLQDMQKSQQDNITARHKLRVKLIKEDKEIKNLHQRIMALHRELAIKINSKKSMRILIQKQKQLEEKIIRQKAAVEAEKKKEQEKELI